MCTKPSAHAFAHTAESAARTGWEFTDPPPPPPVRSPRRHRARADADGMADVWVVLGIVGFVAAMVGLIWCLERV
jgi:hypothetical protein